MWIPKSNEGAWLEQYWHQIGGRVYVEVPLAGHRGPEDWAANSTTRRLDAVRFPATEDGAQISSYQLDPDGFRERAHREHAWIIEVKCKLNRTAIGQVIAGSDLFQSQYHVAPARLVVVCTRGDAALEWVCARRFIDVVKLAPPTSA